MGFQATDKERKRETNQHTWAETKLIVHKKQKVALKYIAHNALEFIVF